MKTLTNSYKGTRDFYPEDKRTQNWMFKIIRETVELFGYEEYDAPVLESTEIYNLKGSQEIISEQSYSFIDRGGRNITMRTEMTPSVSRMVAARRQALSFPLRWYSIPNLWRYERPQRGRLREFWQLNVDLFGIDDLSAEIEIIQIADAILQSFKAHRNMYQIKINSRKLVDYFFTEILQLNEIESDTIRRLIDKKDKMPKTELISSLEVCLSPKDRDNQKLNQLLSFIEAKSLDSFPDEVKDHQSLQNLKQLISNLKNSGITNVEVDQSLMRGFDYYTDIVFEVFDTNPNNNRSMFGGGRYDGLVGLFGVEPIPTIGFGMGDVTLENFLRDNDLIPDLSSVIDVYVILHSSIEFNQAQKSLYTLRSEGVKVAVDSTKRTLAKKIETALKKGIRHVIIIGEQEIADDNYVIKNLTTHQESKHSIERIISIIKDGRNKIN